MKFKLKVFVWSIALGGALVSCRQKPAETTKKVAVKAVDTNYMDQSVKPGDDFFKYSSGGWIASHPIPADKTEYGSFTVLMDENQKQLKSLILEAAESKAASGTVAQKIGNFYSSGMDTVGIDKKGIEPIMADLDAIDALKSNDEILAQVANMQKRGMYPLFYFFGSQDDRNSEMVIANFYQAGIGLPERDYYFNAATAEIRDTYVKHMEKMLVLAKYDSVTAQAVAQQVFLFETRLAKASLTMLENRDPFKTYNKMSLTELQKMAPEADWSSYFTALGLPNPGDINVRQTAFIQEVAKMVKEEALETWKNYLKWNVINGSANYLSSDLERTDFEFYEQYLSGQKEQRPRWKRVLSTTSSALGEAIGKLYVEKFFPPQAKERMINLVSNLRTSLGNRIDQLEWMTDSTKALAHEKLNAINVKVGYPDKWLDYSPLQITPDDYYANIRNAKVFMFNTELAKIGKPYDRSEWGMTPQTVNAYYSPNANEIVFPAAILQPPFFFMDEDDAVNYGAIGVVIGHEMTHGFDDQGRNYDKNGNLTNWWAEADANAFLEKSKIIVNQYNKYIELDSLNVDGELTLGENIADFGGLNISWDAFQQTAQAKTTDKIDGFTPQQRFFLSYAGVWRQNIMDKELARQIKEDVHSPGDARVNVPLYNMQVFYDAFGITPDDKRYIAPAERAIIW
jgi:putative endopeptidase